MWGISYGEDRLIGLDPDANGGEGEIVFNQEIFNRPLALAFDGENLWIGGPYADNIVHIYDREGNLHKVFNNSDGEYGPEGFTYERDITSLVKVLLGSDES